MWDVHVCAACLATDVRMYSMSAASLVEPYRLLTGIEMQSDMPQKLCWECAALVHKFNMFRHKCERASLLLQHLYNQHDEISEGDVLRIDREQFNLISPYSICSIEVHDNKFIQERKIKKCPKDETSNTKTKHGSQMNKAPMEPLVKLEMLDIEFLEKEEIPIEIKSETSDTEPMHDVLVEQDCSQTEQLELPQKIKGHVEPKSERKRTKTLAKDIGMKIELLTQEQQMEAMRERQNTKAYKSARFPCTLCYNSFSAEKSFNNHMLKHDPVSGELVCDLCKYRYSSRLKLYSHIHGHHMKRYSCCFCSSVFYDRKSAGKHDAWHKGVVYTCRICSATFQKTTTYESHLRLKHPMGEVCDQCGEPFHSKKGLLQHINIIHRLKRETVASGGEQEKSGPYCAECDIQFTCKQAWTRHILLSPKHQHERHICDLGCATCGETLSDEESLQAHRVTHQKASKANDASEKCAIAIKCEQCDELLETHRAYLAHFRRVHPGKTRTHYASMRVPSMCEVCGKIFQDKTHLKVHSYKHTGKSPFKCDVCNKVFNTYQMLQIHGNSHTKKSPYKCNICGRAFSSPSNMYRHKAVHTDATPYACEICGKGFKYRRTVKEHFEYVHMNKPLPKRNRSKRQNINKRQHSDDKCGPKRNRSKRRNINKRQRSDDKCELLKNA